MMEKNRCMGCAELGDELERSNDKCEALKYQLKQSQQGYTELVSIGLDMSDRKDRAEKQLGQYQRNEAAEEAVRNGLTEQLEQANQRIAELEIYVNALKNGQAMMDREPSK